MHRIGPGFQPAAPPEKPTHLLVYRDASFDVKFMLLNDVSWHLLARIAEARPSSGRELLAEIAQLLQHPTPERVMSAGADLLEDLRRRDVLLGTRKPG